MRRYKNMKMFNRNHNDDTKNMHRQFGFSHLITLIIGIKKQSKRSYPYKKMELKHDLKMQITMEI